ncbi:MAG: antibiotic biosynthesis monooxygenase [Deltaproteobacteria bacterium]|nr:antibiotic biosynthesis monooxygenase [Deltaproteobacteria bacterium]
MIMLRLRMNVLPEKQKELRQTLLSITDLTGNDRGCLGCNVFCDMEDNHIYTLIEEWETREDMERHIRSERFSVLLGTKSLLAEPLEIQFHTVSRSEGMEVVNALRAQRNLLIKR